MDVLRFVPLRVRLYRGLVLETVSDPGHPRGTNDLIIREGDEAQREV